MAPPFPETPTLSRQLLSAAQAVDAVLRGESLSAWLERQVAPTLRPGVQAISFYTMRHLGFAQAARDQLVTHRTPMGLPDALLLVGLCLLEASAQAAQDPAGVMPDTPIYAEHTLVHQLVQAATHEAATRRAKGFLNAVLRRYGRERETLLARLESSPVARWNHPIWWIREVQRAWPDDWQNLLRAANETPPLTLRVNVRKNSRAQLLAQLTTAGIACHAVGEDGLTLVTPRPIRDIPGYREGWWSVQDVSAQKAARLLPLHDGMRVLDACAAPGGKTAHLLERHTLHLTALDDDARRLTKVADNLARLGLPCDTVTLRHGDAAEPAHWWDGKPFEAILADVPCTASGIVRRHPDIRWLRQAPDIARTTQLQARILDALWPLLSPAGHLLYATCSIFPDEGEDQIARFVARHPDARRLPAPGQILPGGPCGGDGFFYALIAKLG